MAEETINISSGTEVINIITSDDTITLTEGQDEFNIEVGAISAMKAYVDSDTNFPLNGVGGNTYLKYNSTTKKLELWVGGVKQGEWGAVSGGDPFG